MFYKKTQLAFRGETSALKIKKNTQKSKGTNFVETIKPSKVIFISTVSLSTFSTQTLQKC